jgi:hypothetical protein
MNPLSSKNEFPPEQRYTHAEVWCLADMGGVDVVSTIDLVIWLNHGVCFARDDYE